MVFSLILGPLFSFSLADGPVVLEEGEWPCGPDQLVRVVREEDGIRKVKFYWFGGSDSFLAYSSAHPSATGTGELKVVMLSSDLVTWRRITLATDLVIGHSNIDSDFIFAGKKFYSVNNITKILVFLYMKRVGAGQERIAVVLYDPDTDYIVNGIFPSDINPGTVRYNATVAEFGTLVTVSNHFLAPSTNFHPPPPVNTFFDITVVELDALNETPVAQISDRKTIVANPGRSVYFTMVNRDERDNPYVIWGEHTVYTQTDIPPVTLHVFGIDVKNSEGLIMELYGQQEGMGLVDMGYHQGTYPPDEVAVRYFSSNTLGLNCQNGGSHVVGGIMLAFSQTGADGTGCLAVNGLLDFIDGNRLEVPVKIFDSPVRMCSFSGKADTPQMESYLVDNTRMNLMAMFADMTGSDYNLRVGMVVIDMSEMCTHEFPLDTDDPRIDVTGPAVIGQAGPGGFKFSLSAHLEYASVVHYTGSSIVASSFPLCTGDTGNLHTFRLVDNAADIDCFASVRLSGRRDIYSEAVGGISIKPDHSYSFALLHDGQNIYKIPFDHDGAGLPPEMEKTTVDRSLYSTDVDLSVSPAGCDAERVLVTRFSTDAAGINEQYPVFNEDWVKLLDTASQVQVHYSDIGPKSEEKIYVYEVRSGRSTTDPCSFVVEGKTMLGNPIDSEEVWFLDPPGEIRAVTVSDVLSKWIEVSWSDRSDHEDLYVVERSENGDGFEEIARLEADSESFIDTEITKGVVYAYRVRALNEYGAMSPYSDVAVVDDNDGVSEIAVAGEPPGTSNSVKGIRKVVDGCFGSVRNYVNKRREGDKAGCYVATAGTGSVKSTVVEDLVWIREYGLKKGAIGGLSVGIYQMGSQGVASALGASWIIQVILAGIVQATGGAMMIFLTGILFLAIRSRSFILIR